MRNIEHSLGIIGIHNIKIGTSHAMDVLKTSFPPSKYVYPFFVWASDSKNINLDYALFKSKYIRVTDHGTDLVYTNLFDQMINAVYFAMNRFGYPNFPIFIAETGCPNSGDTIGTPLRLGVILQSFLFSLFNENQKLGLGTERHFGLFYPNGKMIYSIDLSGTKSPVPKHSSWRKRWCVVANGANVTLVAKALSYACSQGNGTSDLIQPGKKCYTPNSVSWAASYVFSSYWAQFKKTGGTCYFDGLAT
ncbi:putative glucan endo-1,3-beta-D-glucosidase [Lupinus albus]|uniref:glucan endo-1,3-beta-D-glucosidase n=1 Tax=Lupinus albus TaxID=3870 RepID=A0A6A4RAL4_LUPAL|nr:putative glucan endo-1,3-beta-D-glucosidase [Lupinus albus]